MTYPKSFNARQARILAPIIEQLEQLAPCKELIVAGRTSTEARELRYLVYAWLSPAHGNKKEIFRLRAVDQLTFAVRRLPDGGATLSACANPDEEFFLAHLIDVLDEDQAIATIQAQEPDPSRRIDLLSYWRSKQ